MQSKAKQRKAGKSNVQQHEANLSRANPSKTMQSIAKQSQAMQSHGQQSNTMQSKMKQSKAKQFGLEYQSAQAYASWFKHHVRFVLRCSPSVVDKAMDTSGVAKPMEVEHAALSRVFFTFFGHACTQVQFQALYNKLVLTHLCLDVLRMSDGFDIDIICLSELRHIDGRMEKTRAKRMEPDAVKPVGQLCMERMMLELVDKRAHWITVALAHYSLLVNAPNVALVDQPVIATLTPALQLHRDSVATRFKMAPRIVGGGKPVGAVTVWTVHSPSPNFKREAHQGVWKTFTGGGCAPLWVETCT